MKSNITFEKYLNMLKDIQSTPNNSTHINVEIKHSTVHSEFLKATVDGSGLYTSGKSEIIDCKLLINFDFFSAINHDEVFTDVFVYHEKLKHGGIPYTDTTFTSNVREYVSNLGEIEYLDGSEQGMQEMERFHADVNFKNPISFINDMMNHTDWIVNISFNNT